MLRFCNTERTLSNSYLLYFFKYYQRFLSLNIFRIKEKDKRHKNINMKGHTNMIEGLEGNVLIVTHKNIMKIEI